MTVDPTLAVVATLLVFTLIVSLAALADRHARASAWRQIALERRWNQEQQCRPTGTNDELGRG